MARRHTLRQRLDRGTACRLAARSARVRRKRPLRQAHARRGALWGIVVCLRRAQQRRVCFARLRPRRPSVHRGAKRESGERRAPKPPRTVLDAGDVLYLSRLADAIVAVGQSSGGNRRMKCGLGDT